MGTIPNRYQILLHIYCSEIYAHRDKSRFSKIRGNGNMNTQRIIMAECHVTPVESQENPHEAAAEVDS